MNDLAVAPMNDVGELDRRTYLGSSDIAAILGLSPWKTPVDVFFEKIGQPKPIDGDKEKLFRRGKRLEPVVIDMLVEELGMEITRRGARYRDPAYPWMAAEIDAETVIDGAEVNVEVKTVHPFAAGAWGEMGTDEIPIYYAAQAMYGLMVSGRSRCMFAALFGADNLVTYEIARDDETIDGIRAKAIAFWNDHVLTGIPPEPIVLEDVYRLMRRDVDIIAEATPDIVEMIAAFEQAKYESKRHADHADELKFQIGKWLLGEDAMTMPTVKPKHTIVHANAPLLTVAYQQQNRVDSDLLRKQHPTIAAECSKTSKFYRFDKPRKGTKR